MCAFCSQSGGQIGSSFSRRESVWKKSRQVSFDLNQTISTTALSFARDNLRRLHRDIDDNDIVYAQPVKFVVVDTAHEVLETNKLPRGTLVLPKNIHRDDYLTNTTCTSARPLNGQLYLPRREQRRICLLSRRRQHTSKRRNAKDLGSRQLEALSSKTVRLSLCQSGG
jgi:hypothetical protein